MKVTLEQLNSLPTGKAQSISPATETPTRRTLLGGVEDRVNNIANQVKEVASVAKDENLSPAQRVVGTIAEAGRVPLNTIGQAAGAVGDIATNAVDIATGGGVEAISNKIAKTTSGQKLAKSLQDFTQEHPELAQDLGNIINIAGITGGGAGAKVAGTVAKDVAKAGAETAISATKATGKIAGEVIPSAERIVNHQVTRALELTQGDVKNIAQSTGNEVGEFLANKNLIGANKDETEKLVQSFYKENYDKVRSEIGKVKKTYTPDEIPRFKQSLQQIQKQISGVAGLEEDEALVKTLLKKENVSLDDVQKAKELLDDHFSLYKATGDVKEGVAKEGLSNLRTELKSFIEKEVKNTTGEDIALLNNNVATSRSISDAIETRSTRGLTASNIKLGDLGIFGVGMSVGGPLGGAAAVLGKKILESSAVRLRVAKYLDKLSDAKKAKIQKQMLKGEAPLEIKKLID